MKSTKLATIPRWSSAAIAVVSAILVGRASGQGGNMVHDLSPFRSCGLNALFLIDRLEGGSTPLATVEKLLRPGEDGSSSIEDLERAATALKLDPMCIRADFASLPEVLLPAIVHLKSRAPQSGAPHYVVLLGLHTQGVMTIDPPSGATIHPYDEFARDWTGAAVVFPRDRSARAELLSRIGGTRMIENWRGWLAIAASAVGLGGIVLALRNRPSRCGAIRPMAPTQGV